MSEVSEAPEATVEAHVDKKRAVLFVGGDWTLESLRGLDQRVRATVAAIGDRSFAIDGSRLRRLDTAGALLIARLHHVAVAGNGGSRGQLRGFTAPHAILIGAVARTGGEALPQPPRGNPAVDALVPIGRWAYGIAGDLVGAFQIFGAFCSTLVALLTFRRRMRWAAFFNHLQRAGLQAVPIVALMSFLIGIIIAQQGGFYFRDFGIDLYVVDLVGILVFREIGVLLTAIMLAGRSGSAFTAEIGAMKMREEIDALVVLGVGPVDTLVVPRILALIVALPLLSLVSMISALAGAWVITTFILDIPTLTFLQRVQESIEPRHLFVGLAKAPFMALLIGIIACAEGMRVTGSTESLGRHTTLSVVKSIFMVIVLDGIFAVFFVLVGL